VNKEVLENIDKYYGYAKKISQGDYMDLMHHCLDKIPEGVKQLDRYVYLTLRNEYYNKKSSFNRLYNPREYEEELHGESTKGYDINLLYRIFLELEQEGLGWEVMIFKRCYLFDTFISTSEQTDLSYYKLRQICTYIQDEIKYRYVKHTSNEL